MDVSTAMIRGLGHSVLPMIITVMGECGLRILWMFTVFRNPRWHTLGCLYFSYTLSWALTFILELAVFLVIINRIEKARADRTPVYN